MFAVSGVAALELAVAGAGGDHVVVCAACACHFRVVQGSSGVPGELTVMPDVDNLGVVEANMISPHESVGWLQSWPNIVGGVYSQLGAGVAHSVVSLVVVGVGELSVVVIVESRWPVCPMGSIKIGVEVVSGVGWGLGGDVSGCWWVGSGGRLKRFLRSNFSLCRFSSLRVC